MEKQIIQLLIDGYNKKEIANKLKQSQSVIDLHIKDIYSKFKVINRIQLAITFAKLRKEP